MKHARLAYAILRNTSNCNGLFQRSSVWLQISGRPMDYICGATAFHRRYRCDQRNIQSVDVTTRSLSPTTIAESFRNDGFGGDALSLRKVTLDEVARNIPASCNLAAYVNRSHTLQQFLKLGVDLSAWDEKPDVAEFVLKLDFERDVADRLRFLHNVGVSTDQLGRYLTKNPYILIADGEDLQVRINYLLSKKFSRQDIARIVSAAPVFLLRSTEEVDRRLGHFQKEFGLSGNEVRFVATRKPTLITCDFKRLKGNYFILKEEFGFEAKELKELLKTKPKLWLIGQRSLRERFDYVHNKMGFTHEQILNFPGGLLRRLFVLKQRHLYLVALGRAQFDPKKENYVSLSSIAIGTDAEFCTEVAKTSVEKFNSFLKTL